MSETLEDLTYDYEEDGMLVRRQVDRVVLGKGAWPIVMFLYQELDRQSGQFRAPKMAIVRLKKSRGGFRKQSSLNISDPEQARQITAVFERWYPKMTELAELAPGAGGETDGDDDDDKRKSAGDADDHHDHAPGGEHDF